MRGSTNTIASFFSVLRYLARIMNKTTGNKSWIMCVFFALGFIGLPGVWYLCKIRCFWPALNVLHEVLHYYFLGMKVRLQHAAERKALERERGEAETELARAREAHAAELKRILDKAASSEGASDRDSGCCDSADAISVCEYYVFYLNMCI